VIIETETKDMKRFLALFAALIFAVVAFAGEPLTAAAPVASDAAAPGATVPVATASSIAEALEKVDFSVDLAQAIEASAPQDYQILQHYYPELFGGPDPFLRPNFVPGPDRVTASVLAILLGGLGIHRFYLGETALGILDILFCWTGIPSLVALIDGIVWLFESDEVFYRSWLARNDLY